MFVLKLDLSNIDMCKNRKYTLIILLEFVLQPLRKLLVRCRSIQQQYKEIWLNSFLLWYALTCICGEEHNKVMQFTAENHHNMRRML